jgi:hypothetical protein
MRTASVVGLFCDDIREEKRGTDTLVGIFPDNINVPALPITFAKLAVYIRIHLDPSNDPPGAIPIRIEMPNGSQMPLGTLEESLVNKTLQDAKATGAPIAGLISRAVASPFHLPAAGRLRVIVTIADEDVLAAAINVQVK